MACEEARKFAARIDSALLYSQSEIFSIGSIKEVCAQAHAHQFRAVLIRPEYIKAAADYIREYELDVKLSAAVAFPPRKHPNYKQIGNQEPAEKAEIMQQAIQDGANEFDVVLNVRKLKRGDFRYIAEELVQLQAALQQPADSSLMKVVVEACYVPDKRFREICKTIYEAGLRCISTSTGTIPYGTNIKNVQALRHAIDEQGLEGMMVKACGGIRDFEKALGITEAGADIIGTSTPWELYKEALLRFAPLSEESHW